ncbi:hypothetical protein [Bradyrhizobium manausense]|uniref:hypothetical protein n=1 Tax=Bradyrhizobium manausense TaxID=989370 RepID=UPI001BAB6000|nr:hypothetical protein [Bradyrhizobium manausense]MBR0721785.1 hypothetical protein [Bradyrhizobium manausense]
MDANTPQDADAAELAALCQAVEDDRKAFVKHMEAAMALWMKLGQSRAARDAFKAAYRAKYHLS